jgi:hypothetical protein
MKRLRLILTLMLLGAGPACLSNSPPPPPSGCAGAGPGEIAHIPIAGSSMCTARLEYTSDSGSPATCTTNADCAAYQSAPYESEGGFGAVCRNGRCSGDECLSDADCPASASLCLCGSIGLNLNPIGARCVRPGCNADADCASRLCSWTASAGGVCSPGLAANRYCRTTSDTCHTDADCATCEQDASGGQTFTCQYVPAAGRWQCAQFETCNGV